MFKLAIGAGHYLGTAGAAITVPQDSIYFMNFHVGAEKLDMTETTTNEIFVYRKIK